MIDRNCYLVDKTLLIKDILDAGAKVTLFTRPRRFGKTLNISMLRRYFEKTDEDNSYLFNGLKITETNDKYRQYMRQYPVISISLKSMKHPTWELALNEFMKIISNEFRRYKTIIDSNKIFDSEKEEFSNICNHRGNYSMYNFSLKLLSNCLHEIYGQKAIVLINEYDVPLENAYFNGFYDRMINLLRSVFESVLKTNDSLEFGILTGCLRISKESIFMGLNNLKVNSIRFEEYSN